MRKNIQTWLSLLFLAALSLALGACGKADANSETPRDAVSLWYVEGEALAPEITRLAEEYNASLRDRASLPVSIRSFPDEESLAAAFDVVQPDLLLCSHERAFALYDAGALQDLTSSVGAAAPAYPGALTRYSACIGSRYYPIGFETLLLVARSDEDLGSAGTDLTALLELTAQYGKENGLPFMAVDSLADMLYDMLLALSTELHGVRRLDISNRDYVYAYNLLAEAAYTGGLIASEYPAAALVQNGHLPCAAAASSSLVQAEKSDYVVRPLPQLGDGKVYLAWASGLAVTAREGRSLRSAASFLSWLFEASRLSQTALSSGLVPAAGFGSGQAQNGLQAALVEIARNSEPHLPVPDGDFCKNRKSLEEDLRAAVELLN